MYRSQHNARAGSRPPSAPPTGIAGTKRKERDYDHDTGDETNINVVVRCRGRNEREVKENSGVVVETNGVKGKTVELCMGPNAISNKTYNFDKVFSPAADQAIVFDDVVLPILNEMLAGFNCTIFAYGQTGTGKTYTMSGDMTETYGLLSDAAGIIPRVLQSLFQKLEADSVECSVKCSFIELYNEELRDLLSSDDSVKLKIYDDANKRLNHTATVVQGMEESHIKSAGEGIRLLQQGSHRRQVAATKCNDLSSRSHTVFTITTYVKKNADSPDDYICSGKLNLVDLAGSENIQRSGAENKRAAEAGLINKSLLTLGRVINALVDKSAHIPYRESKLTRLLQDSLGGRTKTCIIATVSPAKSNLEETISTLDYAFRAKNIRNKPQINSMISKKTLLREFTSEIEKLKSELIATRQRNGVYLSNEQFEQMTVESESRRILSEEQKARIETMEVSLRNKVQELYSLTNNFTILKKDNEVTRTSLETTKDVLQQTEIVLKHTKENLEEETKLRKRFEVTEDKLRHVGGELINTIDMSLKDIDGLRSKLRRRSNLHHQNRYIWQKVVSEANQSVTLIDSRLDELQNEHDSMLESIRTRLESFVSEEVEKSLKGYNLTKSISSTLSSNVSNTEKQSASARENMNNVLEEIKELRDDVKWKVGEGLNGLSEAAAKISGEVISELDQFHTQLHTSYSGLGKDFKNMFEDLSRQLISQREENDRLRKQLQEANRKNLAASMKAASDLETVVEAERKHSEEQRSLLMQQITALVTAFDSRRDERVTKSITATQALIVEASEDLESADKLYSQGMDEWVEQDRILFEKVGKSKEDLKIRMQKDWSAVNSRNTAIQESTKAVHEETVKIVDAQLEAMSTQMAALDEFVTRARRENDGHHATYLASMDSMKVDMEKNIEQLESHFGDSNTISFNTDVSGRLEELANNISVVDEEIRKPINQLQEKLDGGAPMDYTVTGNTPQKKDWTYPTELPRTIPLPPSTTPKHPPTTARTPGKSPRKFASPRKSPRKQPVHVDTPPAIAKPSPSSDTGTMNPPPRPASSLKDVDINTASVPTSAQPALVKDTATTKKSTKSNRNGTKTDIFASRNTTGRIEKENVPTSTASASSVTATKFSSSMYVPRTLRSSVARQSPPDFSRSMSE